MEELKKVIQERSSVGGFTVIELLIVVAILGILVAVFLPVWNNWQCLKEEERPYLSLMLDLGKTSILQTGQRMECVEWRRVDD